MAFLTHRIKPLPLSTSLLYLSAGVVLGPAVLGMVRLDPVEHWELLERLSEVAVLVSLLAAGLKLKLPLGDARWWLPARLAFVSMAITVALIAAAAHFLLGLPLGAGVLLGAVLAPTDPVLASDVQVSAPGDTDRLRFALTGEAGLNDGTAFPFVMLGLGLLGLHDLGAGGWRWAAVDVVWAIAGGLAVGWGAGLTAGWVVTRRRQREREAAALDDFLAMGLLALTYGVALLLHTYGFLAAFALGLALRRTEERLEEQPPHPAAAGDAAPADAPPDPAGAAPTSHAVLGFNEQLERFFEFCIVLLLGGMLARGHFTWDALWFVPLVLLVIRPASVVAGLLAAAVTPPQRRLIAWFGIRGVGSVYYLTYALGKGVDEATARTLVGLVFVTIAASIAVHGTSVTPLMAWYGRITGGRRDRAASDAARPPALDETAEAPA